MRCFTNRGEVFRNRRVDAGGSVRCGRRRRPAAGRRLAELCATDATAFLSRLRRRQLRLLMENQHRRAIQLRPVLDRNGEEGIGWNPLVSPQVQENGRIWMSHSA